MKRLVILLLITLFVCTSFSEATEKDWTILIYLAADNGEGEDLEGDAWIDLKEMMDAKLNSENFNLVIEADFGSDGYDGRYVIKDGELEKIRSYDEINMGAPETLKKFLDESIAEFPAKKYMLEFWGHGTGMISMAGPGTIIEELQGSTRMDFPYKAYTYEISPDIAEAKKASWNFFRKYNINVIPENTNSRAFAYDHKDNDSITLVEAKQVLESVGIDFELLSFDCCLMNTLEVNYQFKDFAKYIVSAITTFPGGGYWYTGWLKYLDKHPRLEGRGLSEAILRSNKDFYTDEEAFVAGFVITVKERIKKNLRGQKEAVLQAMKESDIPEEQFEQFIDMYAGNYVKENLEDLIATGQKAFPMQQLNFGMIYTKYLPDVVDSLNNVIRSLDEQGLIALVESRMAAQSFNPAFGEQYGKFYVDTVSLTKMMKENVQNESVKTALEDFKKAIYKAEPKKIVINGDGNIDSARISLLFPEKTQLYGLLDKYYKPLDFSEVSLWDELLGVIAQAMQQQQQPQQEESVETHEGVEREFDIKF